METVNQKPVVSVILTSYNYSRYIREAIESVISQSYTEWELIVFDDGSIDNSPDIILEYCHVHPEKIKLFSHPDNCNKGLKSTLEAAFIHVSGKYTAFLESDDFWRFDCLAKKIKEIEKHENVSLVYSDIEPVSELDGFDTKHIDYLKYCKYIGSKASKPYDMLPVLRLRNPAVTLSNIVIRSDLLKKIKLSENFGLWSDWRVLFHAAIEGKFVFIPEKLVCWRIHENSANFKFMSRIDAKALGKRFLSETYEIIEQILDERGEIEKIKKLRLDRKFPVAQFTRFFHDLGFAVYSPGSVLRELARMLRF